MDLYGGSPYAKLVEMGKKAQEDGVIKGILLHQGENNNMQSDWPEKVEKIYRDLLADLNLDDNEVPLFAGEMLSAAEGGLCAGHNVYVGELPELMNAYVVSSEGCEGASDGLHFTSAGYREMGRHYAEVVLNELYDIPVGRPETPMTALEMEETGLEVQVGGTFPLQLMATFEDGHTENVASMAEYEVEDPGVAHVVNGSVRGDAIGQTKVTATYTDLHDNSRSVSFTIRSSAFPFGEDFIYTNIFDDGNTYDEATHTFNFRYFNGQMGWKYPYGLDMSGYKYLVLEMDAPHPGANVILYPENNIWGSSSMHPVGNGTTLVIPLEGIEYTNGDLAGQPLDISHIMIVALFGGADNASIKVNNMFLTNADYSDGSDDDNRAVYTTEFSPLTEERMNLGLWNVFNNNAFDEDTKQLTLGLGGQAGWVYDSAQDFSGYQYVVVVLNEPNQYGLQLWLQGEGRPNPAKVQADQIYTVADMTTWKEAVDNGDGELLDRSKISRLQFWIWGPGEDKTVTTSLSHVFLTNTVPDWENPEERTTTAGNYGTVCFEYPAVVSGAYVYTVEGKDAREETLYLKPYNGVLAAGVPYIYRSINEERVNFYLIKSDEAKSETPVARNGLVGCLNATVNEGGYALHTDNAWYKIDQEVTFEDRAYLDLDAVPVLADEEAAAANVNRMVLGDWETTGIDEVKASPAQVDDEAVYNLSGVKMDADNLPKGIYIRGGKKFIVK